MDKVMNETEISNTKNIAQNFYFTQSSSSEEEVVEEKKVEENNILNDQNKIFSGLNIYVEIYNNGINQSNCVIPILETNGASVCKQISKNTNFIIFKDGRKKIIQKALDMDIKLINPLWVDDCARQNKLLKIESYRIKKSYTELLVLENKKRKYHDLVLNETKSVGTPGKKKKIENKEGSNKKFITPFIPTSKEKKVKSENLANKSMIKNEREELRGFNIKKEESKPSERKILQEAPKFLNKLNNIDNLNNITTEVSSADSISRSVFGINIRCFNENSKAVSKNDMNKTKQLQKKIPQSSIKLRYNNTLLTPINQNKTKSYLNFNNNNIDNNLENKNTGTDKINVSLNNLSISKANSNTDNNIDISKIEPEREPNIKNDSKIDKSNDNINIFPHNTESNLNLKSIPEKEETVQEKITQRSNLLSNSKIRLNYNKNESPNSKNNNTSKNRSISKNRIQVVKGNTATNPIARSHSKQLHHTAGKSYVRKILLINTPDLNNVKNNEKSALESIDRAIKDENFQQKSVQESVQETSLFSTKNKLSFASLNLNQSNKEKIKNIFKKLNGEKTKNKNIIQNNNFGKNTLSYSGESYKDIEESDYIIVNLKDNNNIKCKDFKIIYAAMLNNRLINIDPVLEDKIPIEKKLLKFSYFLECEKKKKVLPIDSFVINFPFKIDIDIIEKLKGESNLPLKGYKIYLDPNSCVESEQITLNTEENFPNEYKRRLLEGLIALLGGKLVNNIRMGDLCIINKTEASQTFPPHVTCANEDFIYDALAGLKLPDLESIKYKPKDAKYKKNRK